MEQEKINIAALLKDSPKGTRLYSTICGECELVKVTSTQLIEIEHDEEHYRFYEDGKKWDDGECLLFPSKEVRDWGCFRVKYAKGNSDCPEKVRELLLDNGGIDEGKHAFDNEGDYIYFIDRLDSRIKCFANYPSNEFYKYILSTGTELKLEEEQPKFKVGDVVKDTFEDKLFCVLEQYPANGKNHEYECSLSESSVGFFKVARLATSEEIDKWNKEVLEPNHLHYSKSKRKIIHWFLPFDKIVERCVDDDDIGEWSAGLFSHYDKENHPCCPYVTVAGMCNECLPYNSDTARLVGTADEWGEEA